MQEEHEQGARRPEGAAGSPSGGAGAGPGGAGAGPGGGADPSEQEMRARLEEELRKVRVQDLVLQSVASLVNLTARRIGKDDERDLEQARIGIEAVRALTGLLDPEPQAQVRNALSELQMLYAQHARPGERDAAGQAAGGGAAGEARSPGDRPGTQNPPPRLWTPPGAGE